MDSNNKKCPCVGDNLDKFTQPIALLILSKGDFTAYSIAKQMGEYSLLGETPPDMAGVYRQLKILQNLENIEAIKKPDESGKLKQYYHITGKGKECLATWLQTLSYYRNGISALIDEIGESFC